MWFGRGPLPCITVVTGCSLQMKIDNNIAMSCGVHMVPTLTVREVCSCRDTASCYCYVLGLTQ